MTKRGPGNYRPAQDQKLDAWNRVRATMTYVSLLFREGGNLAGVKDTLKALSLHPSARAWWDFGGGATGARGSGAQATRVRGAYALTRRRPFWGKWAIPMARMTPE
ncbi:MAG: hypothetical protein IT380_16775 [Myxococcales bacterium]|nr:hypothetical protein [Myxococcales bacterium]